MTRFRNLRVACSCGQVLAQYKKGGRGRLRKMYLERIIDDIMGIFITQPALSVGTDVMCPACNKRVGTLHLVSGKPSIKINQGVVRL